MKKNDNTEIDNALYDFPDNLSVLIKEFEIRWIAAEGIIKIGRRAILPLLKSIRDGKSTFIPNKEAHHVLNGLLNESEKEKLKPLLLSFDDANELGETAPVEASTAIKTIFKGKSWF